MTLPDPIEPDPHACKICGDTEPFHVHVGSQEPGARRLENYFTKGRGLTEMESAREWKRRAQRYHAALEQIAQHEDAPDDHCHQIAKQAIRVP